MGDQYGFVALDAETKLIPHFEVGKRNMVTAYRFMDTLKARLAEGFRFQFTTDGVSCPTLGPSSGLGEPMRRTSASS